MKTLGEDLVQVGSVIRLHGFKGEIKIALFQGIVLKTLKELVFIEYAQKPVPFFIESCQQSAEQLILKLEDVDSEEAAADMMGRKIWLPAKLVKAKNKDLTATEWVGYEVYDEHKTLIGIAKELVNYNQWLLQVDIDGVEALLPINEETLIEVKKTAKKIYLKIPDGLLELYK